MNESQVNEFQLGIKLTKWLPITTSDIKLTRFVYQWGGLVRDFYGHADWIIYDLISTNSIPMNESWVNE
jgi:hypothetical protein